MKIEMGIGWVPSEEKPYRIRSANPGEYAAEIVRLQRDKALLVELVMDDTLTATAKNCVAIVIRDGGLAPTPSVTAWLDKVVDRIHQQSTTEPK